MRVWLPPPCLLASPRPPPRPRPPRAQAPAAPTQKIRIKLRAYEKGTLLESCGKILEVAAAGGAAVSGPVPLPTRRRLYCVLRSPHVNKNSMEHFQVLTHQRLIDLKDPSPACIDALMQLDLPAGVDVEVKL